MNVEEILRSNEIEFKQKGRDFVVRCLNPDHDDSNPSMRIDRVTGIFHCFSCSFKGNLFKYFGEEPNHLQIQRDRLKSKIKDKIVEGVGLSFPTNRVNYIGNWRDIKPETYKKFEAFEDHSTEYVGRIMFPIRDISGNIVAFHGRHTTGGLPKYLTSPPGCKLPLFPVVKPYKGRIVLVEGLYDVLNLHDKGMTNVACCFGTSNINKDKLSMLKIQGIEGVDIFFDGDEAGQAGAEKLKKLCDSIDLPSRNVYLEQKDPGSLSESQVIKLMKKLYG